MRKINSVIKITVCLVMSCLSFSFGAQSGTVFNTWFSESYSVGGYVSAFAGRSTISVINDDDKKKG